MKLNNVLLKPIVTEKSNAQVTKHNRYTFKVDKRSNKIEIKKAVESFYGITVVDVNTSTTAGKVKNRQTKSGLVTGIKGGYKKAFITVKEGENIDLYSY